MLQLDQPESFGQGLQVQAAAFAGQDFATTVGFQRLLVQIVDTGAFDLTGAVVGGIQAVPCLRWVGVRASIRA